MAMEEAGPFLAMLAISGFLATVWAASRLSKVIGISSMILQIVTGVVLGPGMVQLISPEYEVCESKRWIDCAAPEDMVERLQEGRPLTEALQRAVDRKICDFERYPMGNLTGKIGSQKTVPEFGSFEECVVRSCEHEVSEHCEERPDIFTLIGHAGVALMIFESGMHFDYGKFKVVGPKACAVATLGTLLPLATGAAMVRAFGRPWFPDGIAAGTALAPTSVGVALRLLQESGALQEDFGQAIMTAAFADDVLSLILFNVVFSLGDGGNFDYAKTVVSPIAGVTFMMVASVLAVKGFPRLLNGFIFPRLPESSREAKVSSADEFLIWTMMVVLVGYASLTHMLGNHLWGCYFAGMSFSCLEPKHHAHHVWERQTKRVSTWLVRIFFSCTIAFSIPVRTLLSADALWKGLLMGLGPCILTKVCSALWMGPARFVIGWAMVGRAEFNFLIAQMAVTANMLDDEIFSVVIWSFLWATLLAPLVFRHLLDRLVQDAPAKAVMGPQPPPVEGMEHAEAVVERQVDPVVVQDIPVACSCACSGAEGGTEPFV
mmetsp:Transcript_120291/g.256760  ORF Transcript_120291/g.256760 Transcript_120291/m.256760 type:complete len:546 (+) Transcript_120291:66-1703(+)